MKFDLVLYKGKVVSSPQQSPTEKKYTSFPLNKCIFGERSEQLFAQLYMRRLSKYKPETGQLIMR